MLLSQVVSDNSLQILGAVLVLVVCLAIIGRMIASVSGDSGFRICPRCGFPEENSQEGSEK